MIVIRYRGFRLSTVEFEPNGQMTLEAIDRDHEIMKIEAAPPEQHPPSMDAAVQVFCSAVDVALGGEG